ncbi:DUF2971 domain-containing protein [Flavobacterium sp. PLA-1-15]|uniref:DUF2971 domain-containing protein n=1 Tax=Flavobacterium sp. PLA-1-15 TaxID=3380533 RepID=UPI003B7C55D5
MINYTIDDSHEVKFNTASGKHEILKNGKALEEKLPILFKYLPFNNNTIASLMQGYFSLTNPADFNDPFDCNKTMIVDYEHPIHLKDKVRNYFEDVGICSFSEKQNNPLMWAHYTNNYNGVMLEFQFNDFEGFLYPERFKSLEWRKVIYTNYVNGLHKGFPLSEAILLTSKIKHWEYENEWRIIGKLGDSENRYLPFPRDALKNIYIGHNLFDNHSSEIHILYTIQQTYYPNAKIFRVIPDQTRNFAYRVQRVFDFPK